MAKAIDSARGEILQANAEDVAAAKQGGLDSALLDRFNPYRQNHKRH